MAGAEPLKGEEAINGNEVVVFTLATASIWIVFTPPAFRLAAAILVVMELPLTRRRKSELVSMSAEIGAAGEPARFVRTRMPPPNVTVLWPAPAMIPPTARVP